MGTESYNLYILLYLANTHVCTPHLQAVGILAIVNHDNNLCPKCGVRSAARYSAEVERRGDASATRPVRRGSALDLFLEVLEQLGYCHAPLRARC